jgi:hypothetical protein
LFSTPFQLESGQDTIAKIFDSQSMANIVIAYSWSEGHWVQIGNDFVLNPLTAIYIEVASGKSATASLVSSSAVSSPPSRHLQSGLNLVGPAPPFQNGVFQNQALSNALASIVQTEGGLNGYTMVISPAYNQAGWFLSKVSLTASSFKLADDGGGGGGGGSPPSPTPSPSYYLAPFKGYWVIMDNPDDLFGFSTTPLILPGN